MTRGLISGPGGRLSPSVLMAAGTLMSRVTGLVRTSALAAVLGVGLVSDAFVAASVVPTMLLVLVTGGTLSSALVPMLSRSPDVGTRTKAAGTALVTLSVLAVLASLALAVAAPLLARLLSLGALGQPDHAARVRLVTILLVLLAPQVLLLAVTAVTGAVLTAQGRLGVVGWVPVLTNLAAIAGLGVYLVVTQGQQGTPSLAALVVLGGGSTAAAAAGCAVQLRAARSGLPRRTAWRTRDPAVVGELRRTGSWTLLYAVANQVGLVVVLAVAARKDGVGTAYQWSFTVMQLPYALIGVTLLSATLPSLSRAAGDLESFNHLVRRAAAPLLALLLPATVGLAIFAPVAAQVLVGHGAADEEGTALVARGIALFAAALLPFACFQLLARSCYALRRPAWPALTNLAVNAVTVAGALLALRPGSGDGVLAVLVLSYTASYVVGCLVLSVPLRRNGVSLVRGLLRPAVISGVGTAAGASSAILMRSLLQEGWLVDVASLVTYAVCVLPGCLPWLRGDGSEPAGTVAAELRTGDVSDPADPAR